MAEYIGSRRASEPLAPAPLSTARPQSPFAEDDEMPTCPKCGAGVRPGQEWCTLCLHVLRPPEPAPAPALVDGAVDGAVEGATGDRQPAAAPGQVVTAPPVPPEQVEAAAEALLAQLAVESRQERLTVPDFLDTNAKVGVAVTAAIAAICFVVLVAMTIAGAVLR